jgi:HD-GYP domain-containing protein (c-di-GMP phosphodiesterase class II)
VERTSEVDLEDPTYVTLNRYTKALAVALGYRDLYTRIHSERVLAISEAIGVRLGLPKPELGILTISAAFHDIGKIGVPDQILLKPGRLDKAETAAMQKHSEAGADIIMATELEGAAQVALVIRHHHERFDGKGYPDGLAGEAIPLASRIVGIADSYDAMAMTRAYNPAKTHGRIMEILHEETGGKHDPKLMSVFREIIERSPFKASME